MLIRQRIWRDLDQLLVNRTHSTLPVIPTEVVSRFSTHEIDEVWFPAFAGMTVSAE
jgi:uncharacterized protein (DUF2062 family)